MNDEIVTNTSTPEPDSGCRVSQFINRSKVKRFALEFAKTQIRTKKFTRVKGSFLDRINSRVRNMILDEVKQQPSVGKTLT